MKKTWDASVRWFHWINVLSILYLAGTGTLIWNADDFGIVGDHKVLLKTVHVIGGYVFVTNLLWRLVWAFIGNKSARWSALLPFGKGMLRKLQNQIRDIAAGQPTYSADHTPMARIMISVLLLLMISQGTTGLVLAGTDVYMPPFGSYFAEWVTEGDAERLSALKPGSREHVVDTAYSEMRGFREPFYELHKLVFFALLTFVVVHVAANVTAEVRFASGQISAMFSGYKPVPKQPEKAEEYD